MAFGQLDVFSNTKNTGPLVSRFLKKGAALSR
jgi:hypothetical protein